MIDNLMLATCSNRIQRRCRDVCVETMRRYCAAHPGIRYDSHDIPEAPPLATSWSIINLITMLLPLCGYLLWIDADAMIVGQRDFREIIQPHAINIAKDCNGINL